MDKFEKDIAIDQYNLTEELVQQPQLFYEWASQAVFAGSDTANAKDKLDVVKAEVEMRIRKQPEAYRLPEKPTEAMIRATVLIDRKVKKTTKEWLDLLRVEKLLAKAERAFEHRKKSLEGLVHTNQQSYFSNPKTNSHTAQRVDEVKLLKQARGKRRKIKRRIGYE